MSEKYIPTGIFQTLESSKYNVRYKYIPRPDGSLEPFEELYCDRFIFNPHKVEEHGRSRRLRRERWCSDLDEMYGYSDHYVRDKELYKNDNMERSKRRAKSALFDYVMCNDFSCFVTLTLSPEKIDRSDYKAVISKLGSFLDNRVRRQSLVYVGVPELHCDGAIHFHFLCNDVLNVVDSGTVIRPAGGKPVKQATAKKQGFSLADCRTVYNITDWTLGFSTMYHTYGDVRAVANYIVKYITKGEKKIGGRWYYSGGALLKPVYRYDKVSFNDVNDFTYGFDCDGGNFKVKRY